MKSDKKVDIDYTYYSETKDFSKLLNFLSEKNIIINNQEINNKCKYGLKDESTVYLIIG